MFKYLGFLLVLSLLLEADSVRVPERDSGLRGQSFGLENFLFQTYEDVSPKEEIRHQAKPRRTRPGTGTQRTSPPTTDDSDRAYGLERYESSRLKPVQNPASRRPVEAIAEPSKINEKYTVKKEDPIPETVQETETVAAPERIRKRIMMRRRRKRPSNAVQTDGNSEITGNAILKPVRIPVFPQVPKVIVRTKLPDQESHQRIRPAGATPPPEEVAPQESELTTVTTEKSTTPITTTTTTTEKPSTINLKTFLKQQTETLSLSELLQTQNLSLADLLRGNKDASAILRARQAISSTTPATTAASKRKQFHSVPAEPEPVKKTEAVEVTTSRPNYNRFFPKIPRIKPAVEEIPEEVIRSTKRPPPSSPPPPPPPPSAFDSPNRLNELRTKLRNFQRKTQSSTPQPEATTATPTRDETIEPVSTTPTTEASLPKPKTKVSFKSANNPDISLILPSKTKTEPDNSKRFERPTNWTNRLPSIKRPGQGKTKQEDLPAKQLKVPLAEDEDAPEEPKTTENPAEEEPADETRKPEPKDDLIELLKSGQNADKLQKILDSRNMTIQELLDNREKPTLQTDISQLFSGPTQQETTRPTLFDSLPDFEAEEDNGFKGADAAAYDEPEAQESVPSVARIEPVSGREPKRYDFPIFEDSRSDLDLRPDDLQVDKSNAGNSALWKLSEKSIYYGNSYGYGSYPTTPQTDKPDETKRPELTESDIILLETIRKSHETNRKFKLDFEDFVREEEDPEPEDIEKSYIPPAVKSAIIASGVVMGIALFVFIAIFATCGWKQRQIRLKGSSSFLNGNLSDKSKRANTLSPVSFKDSHSYKKTIDFDEETGSESGSSNTSSYLWNTLKNTFTNRTNTLKSRFEREERMKEDKTTLRRNESRRKVESRADDNRPSAFQTQDERYAFKKIDRDRNVINTSFNFKRSASNNNVNHFNECVHGY